MKLINVIAVAAIVGTQFVSTYPAEARPGWSMTKQLGKPDAYWLKAIQDP